jgi:4-oxalocrotonate tautomerase
VPLARIDLSEGQSTDYRRTIGEVVYDALVEILKVPKDDRFQVITEHPAGDFIFDPNYLGINRSKDCVFIQVTLNEAVTFLPRFEFRSSDRLGAVQTSRTQPRPTIPSNR